MKILVLDFDGVICDSADETARAGWLAGSFLWPEWAKHDITPGMTQAFRKLRPFLHTGFEAIAILKMIENDYSLPFIKTNYNFLMRQIFTSSQYNFDELKAILNRVRNDWIRINEQDWLSRQRMYPGIGDFVQDAGDFYDYVYILTTREGRFVSRFLENSGIDFDREYILGLETGKDKTDSLNELINTYMPELGIDPSEEVESSDQKLKDYCDSVKTADDTTDAPRKAETSKLSEKGSALVDAEMKKKQPAGGADKQSSFSGKKGKRRNRKGNSEILFVDDRFLTLEKIIKDKRLDNVNLYMPSWGYNLPEERYAAENEMRINLLELDDLYLLLE